MPGFVFEKGTYIGGRKKNVFTDIFDRKCLIHVMFSNVAFDHMDGWILMCLISRMFQKVFSLPAKRLMELGKGKKSVNNPVSYTHLSLSFTQYSPYPQRILWGYFKLTHICQES